jgi:beta-lactamase superfamily II metal-dependent hydrolase
MALVPFERLKGLVDELRENTKHRLYRLTYVRQTVDPIREATGGYRLKIVCLDVNHGDSTLIILPTGRVALVDSAKEAWAGRRVIPFLENHNIGEIDYYVLTHFHEDHVGQKERIIRDYHVKNVWDYRTFKTGERLDLEETRLTILNSYHDATDENDRSLAFRLEYQGFSYTHGADLYADGQLRIMERFPELVRTHVYRTNHHVHGSISKEHLVEADPYLFVISAQEAVYERVAYTRDFKGAVEQIRRAGGRLKDVCLTLEKGNVVIFVNDERDWGYSTYCPNVVLTGLYP